jgi:WD40 repeat protein
MSDTPTDGHLEEVLAAYMEAADAGWAPDRTVLIARYPNLRGELEAFFAAQERVRTVADSLTMVRPPQPADGDATLPPGDTAQLKGAMPRAFGDYEDLEEIARGGMGVVFRARQVSANRRVALKMILSGQFASADDVKRFHIEAEAAANLDHPNIVPIYEVGEEDGQNFFSMKLVEGGSVAAQVGRFAHDPRGAARLIATTARAVHHAHQRGILHRDLKPGNVLLDADGQPYVTDFGLAKRIEGDSQLTHSGAIVGTPSYMAPEQVGAKKALTTAADVYALGAILYELLTGQPPFRAVTPLDTLLLVLEKEADAPRKLNPRIDRDLETICLKCLEKEPGRRYESAAALADDLERWLRGEPVRARRTGVVERTWKWARRRPGLAALTGGIAACLLLSVLLGAGYVITGLHLEEAEAARATEARLRGEADAARDSAEHERGRAEVALNINRVMRAQFEWKENEVARAEQLLDDCPEELRDWEWRYVKRLCHSELLSFKGHTRPILDVSFSPDGRRLAGACQGPVRVWDPVTGEVLLTIEGGANAAKGICFSPDGKLLAGACYGRTATAGQLATAMVWNAANGRELRALRGEVHSDYGKDPRERLLLEMLQGMSKTENKTRVLGTSAVCFSPDGGRLAGACHDGTVRVWNAATGQEVFARKGHAVGVSSVCFSPDGTRLASASLDSSVKLWDAATGREERTFRGHTGDVTCVRFSPDGKRLASSSADYTVKLWDAATGQEVVSFRGHIGEVTCVCFSPDGKRLASASVDRSVKVWETATGREERTFRGHTGQVTSVRFSPDGKRLASASEDGTVKVWDPATDQEARILRGHTNMVECVSFSHDGKRLASACGDGTVRVWDATTGQEALTLRGLGPVRSVSSSRDGRRLACACADGTVRVWDATTGQEDRPLKGHTNQCMGVCFSPDGQRLASASLDKMVKVWDVATGQEIFTLIGHTGGVLSVCFSPDGKLLASTSWDKTVRLWDAATGQEALPQRRQGEEFRGVCFSPDGRRLAGACTTDGTVRVWDPVTGQEALPFKGHTGSVDGVCFSPDGRRLASASFDGTVRLWDVATGQESLTLKGHTNTVSSVSFSPDGTRLASASWDQTVRVWDATPLPETCQEQPTAPRP